MGVIPDFNWLVPLIAVATILVNLGINLASQRAVSRTVEKLGSLVEQLDFAREKIASQLIVLESRMKSAEDWVNDLRRRTHTNANTIQKHEYRLNELERPPRPPRGSQ